MQRISSLITALIFSAIISLPAHAARTGEVSLANSPIQLLSTSPNRAVIYNLQLPTSNCDYKNLAILNFANESNTIAKEFYATLMAAKISGRNVEIITGGCLTIAGTSYPFVNGIYLH